MSVLQEISEQFDKVRGDTLREPKEGDFIKHPYGVPAGYYEQLWDWDGFFIAQHLANREDDSKPEYFRYWVLNFIEAYRELGYPPGCIKTKRPEKDRRDFSLKPFIAQAALKGSKDGDFKWLDGYYDDLVAIVTRREETNRDEKTGLFYWDNAMQSGADNNAADSNVEELKGLFLACDLNTFQFEEYRALSEVGWAMDNALHAAQFATAASNIKKAMQEHLWNDELGTYDNRRRDTRCFANCISYSNFVPLWGNVASPDQAESMIRKFLLHGDHLLTPWGCRSLSRRDRAYNNANIIDPYSNWCGPIWPIANYFYFIGLANYGYHSDASKLANRMGRLLLDDIARTGSMHENYCSESSDPLAPSKDQGPHHVEGGFIGWNLLVQDMLEIAEKNGTEDKIKLGPTKTGPLPKKEKPSPTDTGPMEPAQKSPVSLDDIRAAFRPKEKEEELF